MYLSLSANSNKPAETPQNTVRAGAPQESARARELSKLDSESIATKTTDSAALLSSFEEAIRLEVAAEMNLTLKRNEYNDLEDEYGHCGKSNPMNDQEYIECHRVHAAMEEMQTAASRLGENRYKVGIVRRELQKLIREGTEAMETLAAASEDTKVEEGSNRWLVLN